jgi:hypothetical protein
VIHEVAPSVHGFPVAFGISTKPNPGLLVQDASCETAAVDPSHPTICYHSNMKNRSKGHMCALRTLTNDLVEQKDFGRKPSADHLLVAKTLSTKLQLLSLLGQLTLRSTKHL